MTAERWARIKEVFSAASDRPEQERAAFLDSACAADGLLRAEVERLLAQDEETLKGPAATLLAQATPELSVGQLLSHYRVEAKVGAGGTGAVYRAYDTQLHRQVALKVLSSEHFADPESKHRLMREARSASALNHPNIVAVHEIGSDRGVDFIVMEFVEGKSLQELAPAKGFVVGKALDYAAQIAGGLAKAHTSGLVHRDLKPGNIMVTPDGLVKLLDFGLARPVQLKQDETTLSMEGDIAGTPAYMSPEQAEGKKVDARSDIFSFGLVLYEMLSGKRAFRAETRLATMAAILNQEPPPLAEIAPGLPKELERIVARCLRKDLARRSQSMAEIEIALEELKEESQSAVSAGAAAAKGPGSRWRWMASAGTALAFQGSLPWKIATAVGGLVGDSAVVLGDGHAPRGAGGAAFERRSRG